MSGNVRTMDAGDRAIEQPEMPPREDGYSTTLSGPPPADAPVGTILNDLFESTQTLVQQQVTLVKSEVSEEVQSKGKGIGLMVGAGVFAILALAFLGIFVVFGLQEWAGLSGWLSALLVTVLYLVIAGILGLLGRNILQPDGPEEKVEG